jgi:NADH-quinone oxidoreductase subunit D
VHFREPSFVNIQCVPALVEGGLLSDVIPCIASVDSLMGGCDR